MRTIAAWLIAVTALGGLTGCVQTLHMGTIPLLSAKKLNVKASGDPPPKRVSGSACTMLVMQSESDPYNLQRAHADALKKAGEPYNALINVEVAPSGFGVGSDSYYFVLNRCLTVTGTAVHIGGGKDVPVDETSASGSSGAKAKGPPEVRTMTARGPFTYVGAGLLVVAIFPALISVIALITGLPLLLAYGAGLLVWGFGLLNVVAAIALAGVGGALLYIDRPKPIDQSAAPSPAEAKARSDVGTKKAPAKKE